MAVNRRDLLVGMGATAIGTLGVVTAEKAYADTHRTTPLQFYGGYASGIRPDLSPPSVPATPWSGPAGQTPGGWR